jgi:hypothetical protein
MTATDRTRTFAAGKRRVSGGNAGAVAPLASAIRAA